MSWLTQSYDMDTSSRSTWNTVSQAVQSSGRKDSHSTPAHPNLLSSSATSKTDSNCPLTTCARYNIYNKTSNKERQLPGSHLAYLAHASSWALTQPNAPTDFTTGSDAAWPYESSPFPTCDRMQHLGLDNLAPSHSTSRSTPYRIWDTTQQKL